MVAVEKSSSNGSETRRVVKGSWGTKVTRLVADIMDVQDKGEKSIVFSQWEDMIDICQQALEDNAVGYTRARSLKDLSGSVRDLQSVGCDVLLLNVKKAAEGLTILEASHVFLVEPLLNHSLDSQGTSNKTKDFGLRFS
jgi:E3 ubiquitin-protein ligase SHPRH